VVNLDLADGGFFMPLFVTLADGRRLDADLDARIRDRLRREYIPRHVPDRIIQVTQIPTTRTGKKMESRYAGSRSVPHPSRRRTPTPWRLPKRSTHL
jgi:acyl-coenzyme A synthetase/AMP-(fatty) acid ligase